MMRQRKIMVAGEDRLSDLLESLLLHILSLLRDTKEIVRSSVLSTRWRFLWKSVPVSARFMGGVCVNKLGFVASTHKELHYLRSFQIIHDFYVDFRYDKLYTKDIDLWVYFATRAAHVEHFTLILNYGDYVFPQFGFKNSMLMKLVLANCELNPCGSVCWSRLISLSIDRVDLTDGVMNKVLSGCPNLECLKIAYCSGLGRLEINSVNLRKLIVKNFVKWFEIAAPYIQNLRIFGHWNLQLSNVASLVTAFLNFDVDDFDDDEEEEDEEDILEKQCGHLKELFDSLVHVKNLELSPSCVEFLSILELKGRKLPASNRKLLTLNTALTHQDFPAICGLLQSSPELETLIIDWSNQTSRCSLSRFINKNENGGNTSGSSFNYSLLHLKTIKIICSDRRQSVNKFILPLVKHLLEHAEALEKMVIPASLCCNKFKGSSNEMEQKILSFPRSSQHAVVVFTNS